MPTSKLMKFGLAIRSSRFVNDVRKLALGTLVAQIITVLATPILTRIFPPEEFGIYALLISLMMILAVFATLRLELIIPTVRKPADALRLVQIMISTSIVTSLIILFIIILFSSEIGFLLSLPSTSTGALYCLPLLLLSLAAFAGVRGWCIRQGNFAQIAKAQVIRSTSMLLVSAALGLFGSLKAPGLALALGHAFGQGLSAVMLMRLLTIRQANLLLTFSWPRIQSTVSSHSSLIRAVVTSQFLAAAHARIPVIIIATAYGPIQAGFYALSERIVAAPTALVSKSIGDVYRQRAAKEYRAGKPFHKLLITVAGTTLLLAALPFTLAIIMLPSKMATIFGIGWELAGYTIMMLSISAAVGFVTTTVDSTSLIVGARRYMVAWQGLRLAVEGMAAGAALVGLLSYEEYISWIVLGRVLLYLLDFVMVNYFSFETSSNFQS